MDKRSVLILVGIIALIMAITALFYEWRQVPKVVWEENYDFDDKEPMGLYVFKNIVEQYYDVPTTILKDSFAQSSTIDPNSLYITFINRTLKKQALDSLIKIADNGNNVMIVAKSLPTILKDTFDFYLSTKYIYDDSINLSNYTDSMSILFELKDKYFDTENQSIHLISKNDSIDSTHVEANINADVLISMPVGKGRIYIHMIDQVFYNGAYRQDNIIDYAQYVLSHFSPGHVYLSKSLKTKTYSSKDNPLEYIMSSPNLKTAYYLFILGLFLYAIFGGKRKQKIIPTLEKNENTSLEYIDTISQLFYQQNRPEKLVAHMKTVFFHKMQKLYFITPDREDYLQILAKKSKLPEEELKYILDRFKNLEENYTFNDDQLMNLYKRIEYIYDFIHQKNVKN
ncbi:MAG: hypothetical protein V3V14_02535 [Saprospiraceae bacterium]